MHVVLRKEPSGSNATIQDLKNGEEVQISPHIPAVREKIIFSSTNDWKFRSKNDPTRTAAAEYQEEGCRIDINDKFFRTKFDNERDLVLEYRPDLYPPRNQIDTDFGIEQTLDFTLFESDPSLRDPSLDNHYKVFLIAKGVKTWTDIAIQAKCDGSRPIEPETELVSNGPEARDLYWKLYARFVREDPGALTK